MSDIDALRKFSKIVKESQAKPVVNFDGEKWTMTFNWADGEVTTGSAQTITQCAKLFQNEIIKRYKDWGLC